MCLVRAPERAEPSGGFTSATDARGLFCGVARPSDKRFSLRAVGKCKIRRVAGPLRVPARPWFRCLRVDTLTLVFVPSHAPSRLPACKGWSVMLLDMLDPVCRDVRRSWGNLSTQSNHGQSSVKSQRRQPLACAHVPSRPHQQRSQLPRNEAPPPTRRTTYW